MAASHQHYWIQISPIPPLSVRQGLADLLGKRLTHVFPGGTGKVNHQKEPDGSWRPSTPDDADGACLLHLSTEMGLDGAGGVVEKALGRLASAGYTIGAGDQFDERDAGRVTALETTLEKVPSDADTVTWAPPMLE